MGVLERSGRADAARAGEAEGLGQSTLLCHAGDEDADIAVNLQASH